MGLTRRDQRSSDCEIPWLETEFRGPTRTPIACFFRKSEESRICVRPPTARARHAPDEGTLTGRFHLHSLGYEVMLLDDESVLALS